VRIVAVTHVEHDQANHCGGGDAGRNTKIPDHVMEIFGKFRGFQQVFLPGRRPLY